MDKTRIKVVTETKFLGLVFFFFFPHIVFKSHTQYLKTACQKALGILRVAGYTDWGADRTVPRLHRPLVCSKLDYGCILYGSTRQRYLNQLDPIHHRGLRVIHGAFRTLPAQSLHVESHEPSLSFRRLKLSLNTLPNWNLTRISLLTAVFSNHWTRSFSRHLLQKNPASGSPTFTTLGKIWNNPWSDRWCVCSEHCSLDSTGAFSAPIVGNL